MYTTTCVISSMQRFLMMVSKTYEPKKLEASKPYLEKCAEICWLMALHEPALYLNMSVNAGDKFDSAVYAAYQQSGGKVDYLVWPALYSSEGGGLLSKGVVATQKIISKS